MTVSRKQRQKLENRSFNPNFTPLKVNSVEALTVIGSGATSDGDSRSPGRLQQVGIKHIYYER
jgi:hypothetical protein